MQSFRLGLLRSKHKKVKMDAFLFIVVVVVVAFKTDCFL